MPKRYWIGGTPAVILGVAMLVIASGFMAEAILQGLEGVHEANAAYQQNAENDRRQAAVQIADSCDNLSVDEFRQCVSDNFESYYRDQATNEDLQAQQEMAYWAMLLFFLTAVGLLVSTSGVVLLIATIRQGGIGLDRAADAIAAAKDANQIMRDAQRPWVKLSVEAVNLTLIDGETIVCGANVSLKNVGSGVAQNVKVFCEIIISDISWNEMFRVKSFSENGVTFFFPKDTNNLTSGTMSECKIPDQFLVEARFGVVYDWVSEENFQTYVWGILSRANQENVFRANTFISGNGVEVCFGPHSARKGAAY